MRLRLLSVACCALWLLPAHAADIYRWVDDQGKTHLSDTVPERYRQGATRIDPRSYDLTTDQKAEAQNRAAREKARAALVEAQRERMQRAAPARPSLAPASAAPAATAKASQPAKPDDCDTLRRLYRESLDCFAPYVTATGGVKTEAFQKCEVRKDPSPQCGIAR